MPGQPQYPGWLEFNVTDLEVREISDPPPTHAQNIIDSGEPFDLILTFTGKGQDWINMKREELEYQAWFYAEGLGRKAKEIDFGGPVTGNLTPGDNVYKVTKHIARGLPGRGVFKCAAVIEFPKKYGVLGFYDDLLIQVSPREEYG